MRYNRVILTSLQPRANGLRLILTLLLLFNAVANTSFFTLHSSIFTLHPSFCHAQGIPLIRNYTAAEYNGHNRNYDIEIGEDGTIFIANFEGLLYYDRAQWHILHTQNINRVTVVLRDSKNTVWVGGYNYFARVQRHPNGELYLQQIGRNGQFEGEVMEIFEDGGTLQFVASDNIIYEVVDKEPTPAIVPKKRTNANFRIGVESDIVSVEALKEGNGNALLEDITQTEELDGGFKAKVKKNLGLIITDHQDHTLYTITEANGLCSNQVAYVAYDGHGMLWGATAHGVFSIEMPSVYSYLLPKDGLTGEVHTITAYNGKIYVGGTNGLFCVTDRQCRRIPEISNICWTMGHTRNGLLVATSSGIYKIRPDGTISRMTSNATTAMLVDGDKVYAGEPDGVWLYQDEKRQQLVNALPLVTEIRQGKDGQLWLKNVHGETRGKDPGKAREPIDDLPATLLKPISDFEVMAQYRHGDQIWIGGDEILAVIDAGKKDLAKLPISRHIRFRTIIMGADSVLWGGYGDMPRKLPKLGSDEGHLHFYYALDYAPLSGKTLYRYKLNDSKWSTWSDKQDVEFLNLPYGSFTLSIQAQLANGELSEVATIGFSIAYPLLMRWYTIVIYLIILAYLVYLLFHYRLKRLEKDKIKLEHIIEERTSEVVKQKDEIEEKSKSLELALDDLHKAQHKLIRQEKMASVGKLTEGLIDRILNPMNYIINFSKMSNDLLKDLKENIDNNKDTINEDDYEDTLDVLGMLTQNLESVNQYGQNTTRTLKAMEEMLKDRTGGYVDMDLLPVLKQDQDMVDSYFTQEKEQYHIRTTFNLPAPADGAPSSADGAPSSADSAPSSVDGDLKSPLMPLHGNPDMLSKTIMSLLGNAFYAVVKKAQQPPQQAAYQPEISLTATIADGQYVLKIRDNGIGIEEKILGKIFDPFFTTKTTGEAAGVGLYLSREIIQNHNGDIGVVSVKGEYTEFTLTLPAAL